VVLVPVTHCAHHPPLGQYQDGKVVGAATTGGTGEGFQAAHRYR